MSFGGFGLSPGDFILLVQLARRTFRNCQQAGDEYAEIASEVRCLYSVLRTVRTLAERPDSSIVRQDQATTTQLISCADGCKHVLDGLDDMLAKYTTLNSEGQPSVGKKIWQRFRFGSKIEELGVIRGKLVTYTSTMSILIDQERVSNGLLENAPTKELTSANEAAVWSNRMFSETFESLPQVSARGIDEEASAATDVSLPPAVAIASDPSPAEPQTKALINDVGGLQEPRKIRLLEAQDIPYPLKPGRHRPKKVTWAQDSTSESFRNGTRQVTFRPIKSILRLPTPRFPEYLAYVREGVGLREHSVGGKLPNHERVTRLDKNDFDITAVRWLSPRCEDQQDHILVFNTLDDTDINVMTKLTALYRDYPGLGLHWLFDLLGGVIQAFHPKFFIRYGAYNEHNLYESQSCSDKRQTSLDLSKTFSKSFSDDDIDWEIEHRAAASKELRYGIVKLCIDSTRLSERRSKELDDRLDVFMSDMVPWIAKELRLPQDFVSKYNPQTNLEDKLYFCKDIRKATRPMIHQWEKELTHGCY